MLGLLSCALNRVIIELCQEKSSNHEKHGWNFYAKVVFLQPPFLIIHNPGRVLTPLCLGSPSFSNRSSAVTKL